MPDLPLTPLPCYTSCCCLLNLLTSWSQNPGQSHWKSLWNCDTCCWTGFSLSWMLCSASVQLCPVGDCWLWYKHWSSSPSFWSRSCKANWANKVTAATSYSQRKLQQRGYWAAGRGYFDDILSSILHTVPLKWHCFPLHGCTVVAFITHTIGSVCLSGSIWSNVM